MHTEKSKALTPRQVLPHGDPQQFSITHMHSPNASQWIQRDLTFLRASMSSKTHSISLSLAGVRSIVTECMSVSVGSEPG